MPTDSYQSMLFGRYRAGSFSTDGAIFRARATDVMTEMPVGIVAIDIARFDKPQVGYGLERLRADVERAAAMTHPSVLQAIGLFEEAQRVYLVQQQPEGIALARVPRAGHQIGFVTNVIMKMLYLYGYYHECGLTGLCLTPAVMYLTPAGILKVENFAIARLAYVAEAILRDEFGSQLFTPPGAFVDRAACEDEDRRQAARVFEALLGLLSEERAAEPAAAELAVTLRRLKGADGEAAISIADATDAVRDVARGLKGNARPVFTEVRDGQPRQARRSFRAGALLFAEGDLPDGEGYILEEGLVQISKIGADGREIFLDLSKPGDIIGEMALIDSQPRMASARAIEPSTVIVIKGAELFSRLEKTDKIARMLIEVLAKRLRHQAGEVARLKGLLGMGRV